MRADLPAAKPSGRRHWVWDIVGLLFNAGTLFGLTGSICIGTSAYLTATCLVWIGGMVLFGIGALLVTQISMVSGRWKTTTETFG
jgi:hypothetical protein